MFDCFDTVHAVLQVTTGVMSTLKVSAPSPHLTQTAACCCDADVSAVSDQPASHGGGSQPRHVGDGPGLLPREEGGVYEALSPINFL